MSVVVVTTNHLMPQLLNNALVPRYALRRHLHEAATAIGAPAYQDPITYDLVHTEPFLAAHPELCAHARERHCPHMTQDAIQAQITTVGGDDVAPSPPQRGRRMLDEIAANTNRRGVSPLSLKEDMSDDDDDGDTNASSSSSSTSSYGSESSHSTVNSIPRVQNRRFVASATNRAASSGTPAAAVTVVVGHHRALTAAHTQGEPSSKQSSSLLCCSPFQRRHSEPFVVSDVAPPPLVSGQRALIDIEELRAMPRYRQYSTLHRMAVEQGKDCYRDVATGCIVFCRPFLAQQACCGEDCRHCPYGRHKGRSELELRQGGGPQQSVSATQQKHIRGDTREKRIARRGGVSTQRGRGASRHYSSSSSQTSSSSSGEDA